MRKTNDLRAAVLAMGQRMGPNAGMLGMNQDEIVKKFGSGGYEKFVMQQHAAMKSLAGQGFDPHVLQQGMGDFAASAQSQIPDVDKRIQALNGNLGQMSQKWIDIRESQQKANAIKPTTVEDAFENFSATLPELTKSLGLLTEQLSTIISLPLLKILTPLASWMADALTSVSKFTVANKALVSGVADLGIAALSAYNVFTGCNKLMSWAPCVAGPLLGIVTELGEGMAALGGGTLAEGGILAAIAGSGGTIVIGAAIAAGVAVVWKMFGPQISKAAGDLSSQIVRAATSAWDSISKSFTDFLGNAWDGLHKMFPWLGGSRPSSQSAASLPMSQINGANGFGMHIAPLREAVKQGVTSGFTSPKVANAVPIAAAASSGAGWLSAKYESGNPGTIGDGTLDKHGVRHWAYGAWQMDHVAQTPNKFVNSLQNSAPDIYGRLSPLLGSTDQGKQGAFGQMWKQIAGEDPARFKQLQKTFMMKHYLQPLLNQYGSAASSPSVQEALFSTSVHHGVGGAQRLARRAGVGHVSNEEFLKRLYEQRDQATSGRFHNRFSNESNDVCSQHLCENKTNCSRSNLPFIKTTLTTERVLGKI